MKETVELGLMRLIIQKGIQENNSILGNINIDKILGNRCHQGVSLVHQKLQNIAERKGNLNKSEDTHGDEKTYYWGTWVAQWVKASAFGSGHDPRVLGSSPTSGSLLSREPASLSLFSLCLPLCLLVISLCQISK